MTLKVTDTATPANSATQSYSIVVSTPLNDAGRITSTPVTFATANNPYIHNVPSGPALDLPLTFSLTTYPTTPNAMTINPGDRPDPVGPDQRQRQQQHGDGPRGRLRRARSPIRPTQLDVADTHTLEGQKYTNVPTRAHAAAARLRRRRPMTRPQSVSCRSRQVSTAPLRLGV